MSERDYDAFIRSKGAIAVPTGIEDVPPLGDYLFEFQKDLVRWALRRGKAALFCSVGTGKTRMQLAFAEQANAYLEAVGEPSEVIILTPLAVAQQTVREGKIIGIDTKYCKDPSEIVPGVMTVTNYDRLERFFPVLHRFGTVILDECFSPDTMIDVVFDDATIRPTPIAQVRAGFKILNAAGVDVVADVHRREVPYGVRVTIGNRRIVASPNHPFFTQRGWVGAQDLEPGDHALDTRAAMRMVRSHVSPEALPDGEERRAILRSILLSEMADAPTGTPREDSQSGNSGEAWPNAVDLVARGLSESAGATGENHGAVPVEPSGGTGEDFPPVERDRPQTFRAWGQRTWLDGASEDSSGCTRTDLAGGVCLVTGPADSRLSDALQARSGASREASVHRGGWVHAQHNDRQATRQEEECETGFARVDGIEILEPGHPELERLRSPDGKLYFFDIGASRHPSFSVDGILVHNSSVIKHDDSKTRQVIIDAFQATPFRLACTATPAPNDRKELGNHAEFLGVMKLTEMLSEFFVHDSGKTKEWRLKGHAELHFWQWVASWGAMVTKPSDLGYSDERYNLPPLRICDHAIPATVAQDRATRQEKCAACVGEGKIANDPALVEMGEDGFVECETCCGSGKILRGQLSLFPMPATNLVTQRKARRATLDDRVNALVDIVAAEPNEQWLVWCELNDEADAVEKLLRKALAGVSAVKQVSGSDSPEFKSKAALWFSGGRCSCEVPTVIVNTAPPAKKSKRKTPVEPAAPEMRCGACGLACGGMVLVSKSSIFGFGLNFQSCARAAFVGVSHKFEEVHQALGRNHRFGQKREVHAHFVYSELEGDVRENLRRKAREFGEMADKMRGIVAGYVQQNVTGLTRGVTDYNPTVEMAIAEWLVSEAS